MFVTIEFDMNPGDWEAIEDHLVDYTDDSPVNGRITVEKIDAPEVEMMIEAYGGKIHREGALTIEEIHKNEDRTISIALIILLWTLLGSYAVYRIINDTGSEMGVDFRFYIVLLAALFTIAATLLGDLSRYMLGGLWLILAVVGAIVAIFAGVITYDEVWIRDGIMVVVAGLFTAKLAYLDYESLKKKRS